MSILPQHPSENGVTSVMIVKKNAQNKTNKQQQKKTGAKFPIKEAAKIIRMFKYVLYR